MIHNEIHRETDITGPVARQLRMELGMSQPKFWGPLGVKKSASIDYEHEKRPMPFQVRRLVFLHHVVGVPFDMDAEHLSKIFEGEKTKAEAIRELKKAVTVARGAVENLESSIDKFV